MVESLEVLAAIVEVVDGDRRWCGTSSPSASPSSVRRGLYQAIGGADVPDLQLAMLWVLNLADGEHSLLDIADRDPALQFDHRCRGAARSTRAA